MSAIKIVDVFRFFLRVLVLKIRNPITAEAVKNSKKTRNEVKNLALTMCSLHVFADLAVKKIFAQH
jgi:hypothetical protein